MDIFNEYKNSIEEKISEELYLWLIYPLSAPEGAPEVLNTLSPIEKEIISFINQQGKSSVVFLMDKLKNYEDEDILEAVFKLMKSNLVIPHNND
jgi:hypothetical protein